MDSPIREQIRLDDRWQSRPDGRQSSSVYVPAPWRDKRVVLKPAPGERWSAVTIEGQELSRPTADESWQADAALAPGQWNSVEVENGTIEGARLVASHPFHITALEATPLSEQRLSVRVRLDGPAEGPPGLFTLLFTLSAADGRHIGGMDVTVGRKARDLTVEMVLPERIQGSYRLKASLCEEDAVIDNARIDLEI